MSFSGHSVLKRKAPPRSLTPSHLAKEIQDTTTIIDRSKAETPLGTILPSSSSGLGVQHRSISVGVAARKLDLNVSTSTSSSSVVVSINNKQERSTSLQTSKSEPRGAISKGAAQRGATPLVRSPSLNPTVSGPTTEGQRHLAISSTLTLSISETEKMTMDHEGMIRAVSEKRRDTLMSPNVVVPSTRVATPSFTAFTGGGSKAKSTSKSNGKQKCRSTSSQQQQRPPLAKGFSSSQSNHASNTHHSSRGGSQGTSLAKKLSDFQKEPNEDSRISQQWWKASGARATLPAGANSPPPPSPNHHPQHLAQSRTSSSHQLLPRKTLDPLEKGNPDASQLVPYDRNVASPSVGSRLVRSSSSRGLQEGLPVPHEALDHQNKCASRSGATSVVHSYRRFKQKQVDNAKKQQERRTFFDDPTTSDSSDDDDVRRGNDAKMNFENNCHNPASILREGSSGENWGTFSDAAFERLGTAPQEQLRSALLSRELTSAGGHQYRRSTRDVKKMVRIDEEIPLPEEGEIDPDDRSEGDDDGGVVRGDAEVGEGSFLERRAAKRQQPPKALVQDDESVNVEVTQSSSNSIKKPSFDYANASDLDILRRAPTPYAEATFGPQVAQLSVRALLRSREDNRQFVRNNQRLLDGTNYGLQTISEHDEVHQPKASAVPANAANTNASNPPQMMTLEDTILAPRQEKPLSKVQATIRKENLLDEDRIDRLAKMSGEERINEVLDKGIQLKHHDTKKYSALLLSLLGEEESGDHINNGVPPGSPSTGSVANSPLRGTLSPVSPGKSPFSRGTPHSKRKDTRTPLSPHSKAKKKPNVFIVHTNPLLNDGTENVEWPSSLSSNFHQGYNANSPGDGADGQSSGSGGGASPISPTLSSDAGGSSPQANSPLPSKPSDNTLSRSEQLRLQVKELVSRATHNGEVTLRLKKRQELLEDVTTALTLWDERINEAGLGSIHVDEAIRWTEILELHSLHKALPSYVTEFVDTVRRRKKERKVFRKELEGKVRREVELIKMKLPQPVKRNNQKKAKNVSLGSHLFSGAKNGGDLQSDTSTATIEEDGNDDDKQTWISAVQHEMLKPFVCEPSDTLSAQLYALRSDEAFKIRQAFRNNVRQLLKTKRSGQCDEHGFVCLLYGAHDPTFDDFLIRQLVAEVRRRREETTGMEIGRWFERCDDTVVSAARNMYLHCRVGQRKLDPTIQHAIVMNPDVPLEDDVIAKINLDVLPEGPEVLDVRALDTSMGITADSTALPTSIVHLFGISYQSFKKSLRKALAPDEARRIFNEIDADQDGFLNFFEFAKYLWPSLCERNGSASLDASCELAEFPGCDTNGNILPSRRRRKR